MGVRSHGERSAAKILTEPDEQGPVAHTPEQRVRVAADELNAGARPCGDPGQSKQRAR